MKRFFLATITGVMLGAVVTTQVAGPLVAQEADKKRWFPYIDWRFRALVDN